MKVVIGASLALAGLVSLSACETTSSRPYTVSTENVVALQQAFAGDAKVQLGDFAAAPEIDDSPTCRALGALEVAPGKTPIEFIEGAMRDELFQAGAFDVNADTVISGTVETLEFNSFGTGSWDIGLTLRSNALPDGYTVNTRYEFKTSFSAVSACQNVIDAFTPATQQLISEAVAHPQFKALSGTAAGS